MMEFGKACASRLLPIAGVNSKPTCSTSASDAPASIITVAELHATLTSLFYSHASLCAHALLKEYPSTRDRIHLIDTLRYACGVNRYKLQTLPSALLLKMCSFLDGSKERQLYAVSRFFQQRDWFSTWTNPNHTAAEHRPPPDSMIQCARTHLTWSYGQHPWMSKVEAVCMGVVVPRADWRWAVGEVIRKTREDVRLTGVSLGGITGDTLAEVKPIPNVIDGSWLSHSVDLRSCSEFLHSCVRHTFPNLIRLTFRAQSLLAFDISRLMSFMPDTLEYLNLQLPLCGNGSVDRPGQRSRGPLDRRRHEDAGSKSRKRKTVTDDNKTTQIVSVRNSHTRTESLASTPPLPLDQSEATGAVHKAMDNDAASTTHSNSGPRHALREFSVTVERNTRHAVGDRHMPMLDALSALRYVLVGLHNLRALALEFRGAPPDTILRLLPAYFLKEVPWKHKLERLCVNAVLPGFDTSELTRLEELQFGLSVGRDYWPVFGCSPSLRILRLSLDGSQLLGTHRNYLGNVVLRQAPRLRELHVTHGMCLQQIKLSNLRKLHEWLLQYGEAYPELSMDVDGIPVCTDQVLPRLVERMIALVGDAGPSHDSAEESGGSNSGDSDDNDDSK